MTNGGPHTSMTNSGHENHGCPTYGEQDGQGDDPQLCDLGRLRGLGGLHGFSPVKPKMIGSSPYGKNVYMGVHDITSSGPWSSLTTASAVVHTGP